MVKKLVIVESPNKVSKISKILNDNSKDSNKYLVKATGGHIWNLDKKSLSIDIENNFNPKYVYAEDPFHKKAISEIKKAYKECQEVLIASDLDMEGENIGYSVCHLLKIPYQTTGDVILSLR